jgi:adenosine kinase
MTILVCGSLAYDCIMVFQDQFKKHILPDKIHILNVSFLVPELRREFGGCAGNIAYNLRLLGESPTILATVGRDFEPYSEHLDRLGLSQRGVRRLPDQYTAQCFITTDLDDNQITAFHPGAMSSSNQNRARTIPDVSLAIVGPDGRDGMLAHSHDLAAAGIPFVFDPGQAMPLFSGEELLHFLGLASFATFNDYEASLLCERARRSLGDIAQMVKALVVTRGGEGSTIYAGGEVIDIRSVKPDQVADPTGCGDAYRAGLLYGIQHGWTWRASGQLASLLGSIKIAHRGGQNHRPSRAELAERYAAAFGTPLNLEG